MNPPFLLGQDGIPGSYKLTRLARQDYEAKYDPKPSTIVVDKQLTDLLPKLTDAEERGYLEEALACFRIKAYRAAIVMTWNVAYGHLCKVIINKKLAEFNQTLPRRLPNANRTVITKQEDLAEFKEFDVLAVARSADIIDKNAHKIWMHRLEDRNMAAHPNKVIFKQLEVEAFIHNLIENCFLPLKP
ncbi:MAG TPA: hypothetical protein VL175_13915 [Pirellulales bacterium]|jgi:hypothetical protein|nr:hypothetical protein [Pirellulales bacterium]